MIHIILTILKIIGIILLVILGLLLLIILSVLFLPLKYNGKMKLDGDNQCVVLKGRYFFGILRFKAEYSNKKLDYYFKILWKDLLSKNKKTTDKKDGENHNNTEESDDIFDDVEDKTSDKITLNATAISEARSIDETSKNNDSTPEKEETISKENIDVIKQSKNIEYNEDIEEAIEDIEEKKTSIFTKIKNTIAKVFKKIFDIKSNIESIKDKIIFKIKSFCDKLKNINNKKNEILVFLNKEDTKKFMKLVRHQIFLLFKHILPYKLKGKVLFGMDSPDKTGQTLAVMSVVKARYGKKVDIVPDFDKKIMVVDLKFYGRIRVFSILIILIKVVLQKKFRDIIKMIKK